MKQDYSTANASTIKNGEQEVNAEGSTGNASGSSAEVVSDTVKITAPETKDEEKAFEETTEKAEPFTGTTEAETEPFVEGDAVANKPNAVDVASVSQPENAQ